MDKNNMPKTPQPTDEVVVVAEDPAATIGTSPETEAPKTTVAGTGFRKLAVYASVFLVAYATWDILTTNTKSVFFRFVGGVYETVGDNVFKYAVHDGKLYSAPAGAAALICITAGLVLGWFLWGRTKAPKETSN